MQTVKSPFVGNIEQCRSVMKRLRKKIYKYTSTHKQVRKPKDSLHDILGLLKSRNIPSFVLDPIKKRRNFDLSSLQSVMVSPGASLQEITNRTNNQEYQIQNLFKQHQDRMMSEKKSVTPKFDKKITSSTTILKKRYEREQNYEEQISQEEYRFEDFMSPDVSEFKILEDYEQNNYPHHLDFFVNQGIGFSGHSLFGDEEN